jgi:hypothetical protein
MNSYKEHRKEIWDDFIGSLSYKAY